MIITHKKTTELLKNWGLEKEPVTDVIYEQTGNRNENAFYVGEKYVIKFSVHIFKQQYLKSLPCVDLSTKLIEGL